MVQNSTVLCWLGIGKRTVSQAGFLAIALDNLDYSNRVIGVPPVAMSWRGVGPDGRQPQLAKGFQVVAKKILAVDDETDVLLVIKTALQSEGFEVSSATNGQEALDKIPSEKPDLVILDVMMPGMTGFEVLDKMKSDPDMAGIPVIMLTGLSERSKIKQALESGTDYYIVKPFDFHDLMSKVNDALNSSTDDPFHL